MDILRRDTVFATINAAISGQQVVQIKHKNNWRTIEPYLVGLHRVTQELALYGYGRDIVPGCTMSSRWEVFHLNEVDGAELTNYSFLPHVDYNGRTEAVQPVYRRLKPLFSEIMPGYWPARVMDTPTRNIRLSKQ